MKENRILLMIFTVLSLGASVFAYKHEAGATPGLNAVTPPPGWTPNPSIQPPTEPSAPAIPEIRPPAQPDQVQPQPQPQPRPQPQQPQRCFPFRR